MKKSQERQQFKKKKKKLFMVWNEAFTLVLFLISDFFIVSVTKGSALPIKSTTGRSSAEMTVTERTPLTITSLLFFVTSFTFPVISILFAPFLSTFSKEVIEKLEAKELPRPFSIPKGRYKSSRCT